MFKEAIGYEDISLLPNFSDITSRKQVSTKTKISKNKYIDIPIILSPMDTVSSVKSCTKINQIGGAGVLHRFMSIEDQTLKSKKIKDQSNFCINAIGLKDAKNRLQSLAEYTDIFFLDTANGLSTQVEEFLIEYKQSPFTQDIIVGNTLTKERKHNEQTRKHNAECGIQITNSRIQENRPKRIGSRILHRFLD
jgi:IMP dehydrogenase